MATFTIWECGDGGISLGRGTTPSPADVDPVSVLEFQAASWEEACQVKNDRYGWGEYVPPEGGWEPIGPDED